MTKCVMRVIRGDFGDKAIVCWLVFCARIQEKGHAASLPKAGDCSTCTPLTIMANGANGANGAGDRGSPEYNAAIQIRTAVKPVG